MNTTDAAVHDQEMLEREHAESLLDEALRETFPASDPIAVFVHSRPAESGGWAQSPSQ